MIRKEAKYVDCEECVLSREAKRCQYSPSTETPTSTTNPRGLFYCSKFMAKEEFLGKLTEET